jgi:hypothetical protein
MYQCCLYHGLLVTLGPGERTKTHGRMGAAYRKEFLPRRGRATCPPEGIWVGASGIPDSIPL